MTEDGLGEVNETEDPLEQFRKEWDAYRKERNNRLHRFFVRVVAIFALLGLTVSATVYYVYVTSADNTEALCAIRHDAERRVAFGEEFLKENPNGIPGISADSLRRSTANSKQTVRSLSNLSCLSTEKPTSTEFPTPTP